MAAASLLALIDDIALVLDDVALMTKVAAKKTAGVLGDDLALNAQQVAGVRADRELPVVWAVARGSLINKVILVPLALAISAWVPALVTPLLMAGGLFLCFEGVEKLAHRWLHSAQDDEAHERAVAQALADPQLDMVQFERDKIRGAVRTDFILSAEIITISLGTVTAQPLVTQASVLSAVAVVMTAGVYGLVAGIVKLDDLGLWLSRREGVAARSSGAVLLRTAPWLMKALAVAGTAAMFLVGGSILVHGLPPVHHAIESGLQAVPGALGWLVSALADALVGVVAGAVALVIFSAARRLLRRS